MSVTVGQILDILNGIAPLELAEEWDNVGLLIGSRNDRADTVLCALDLNRGVLNEAIQKGAQLIVTHHPILFRGRKNLCTDEPEGRLLCDMVRAGIALIAMHTNYDNAHPGVNDGLAEKIGLRSVMPLESGMCIGDTEEITLRELKVHTEKTLGGVVRAYGNPETKIRRVAVLGGAGEDYAGIALCAGADAYITGETAYHKALDMVDRGLCVLEAGHAATENPAISNLAGGLQNALNDVQYKVRVLCSAEELFL